MVERRQIEMPWKQHKVARFFEGKNQPLVWFTCVRLDLSFVFLPCLGVDFLWWNVQLRTSGATTPQQEITFGSHNGVVSWSTCDGFAYDYPRNLALWTAHPNFTPLIFFFFFLRRGDLGLREGITLAIPVNLEAKERKKSKLQNQHARHKTMTCLNFV